MSAKSIGAFKFEPLDGKFGWVQMTPRLGVVIKALNSKRTRDGRDFDITAAYFGFDDEAAARQFALWANRKWPQGDAYRPLVTMRAAERLAEAVWEVKVRQFPEIAELVRMAQKKDGRQASHQTIRTGEQVTMPDLSRAQIAPRAARQMIVSRDGQTAVGIE